MIPRWLVGTGGLIPRCLVGTGLVALVACVAPPEQWQQRGADPADASISVVVHRGFRVPRAPIPALRPRVEIVVDAGASMRRATEAGARRLDAARGGGEELARSLPQDTQIALRLLGDESGCAPARLVSAPELGDDRNGVIAALRDLPRTRGGSSLAATLGAIRADLESRGTLAGTRTVAFTDLEDSCNADLCRAAEDFVAAGGWVDVVMLGGLPAPGCLSSLRPSQAPTSPLAALAPSAPSGFTILAGEEPEGAAILARGFSGETVRVPPGDLTLRLDLVPPEEIGPIRVAPGENVRVRVLDLPVARPPHRTWRVDRGEERFDAALPSIPSFEGE